MSLTLDNLCLKWGDFQQNIAISYGELRKDPHFSDVTLVSEEGLKIEAHRIILIASSSFFSNLFSANEHNHPMIYMKGLKTKDLMAIVDFIYHGETSVHPDDLERFCTLAQELQLKGLIKSESYPLDNADGEVKRIPIQKEKNYIADTSLHVEDVLSDDVTNTYITPKEIMPIIPKTENDIFPALGDGKNLSKK